MEVENRNWGETSLVDFIPFVGVAYRTYWWSIARRGMYKSRSELRNKQEDETREVEDQGSEPDSEKEDKLSSQGDDEKVFSNDNRRFSRNENDWIEEDEANEWSIASHKELGRLLLSLVVSLGAASYFIFNFPIALVVTISGVFLHKLVSAILMTL